MHLLYEVHLRDQGIAQAVEISAVGARSAQCDIVRHGSMQRVRGQLSDSVVLQCMNFDGRLGTEQLGAGMTVTTRSERVIGSVPVHSIESGHHS